MAPIWGSDRPGEVGRGRRLSGAPPASARRGAPSLGGAFSWAGIDRVEMSAGIAGRGWWREEAGRREGCMGVG
jgi:hypothetical protein